MFSLTVEGADTFAAHLGRAAEQLDAVTRQVVEEAAQAVALQVRATSKSRRVRAGTEVRVQPAGAEATVLVPFPGRYVERGRRPGRMPPLTRRFRAWARAHGIDPYLAARAVGRRGVAPAPAVGPAVEVERPRFPQRLREATERLLRGG